MIARTIIGVFFFAKRITARPIMPAVVEIKSPGSKTRDASRGTKLLVA